MIFDKRAYVATNAHVVDGAWSLEVVFIDGCWASATLVNLDANYDVAILKVADGTRCRPSRCSAIPRRRSSRAFSVIATGSPLGTDYQNTVTSGIIAGLNSPGEGLPRRATGPFGYTEERDVNGAPLIQTDAAINSGNPAVCSSTSRARSSA
ncbi:MAG: trypsin-like peptidase domain-containing protein [Anaerolineae bacterium]